MNTHFSDEATIDTYDSNVLTLTTHRIIKIQDPLRQSIMLEKITSCQIIRKTKLLYLILAFFITIVSFLIANALNNDNSPLIFYPSLFIAIILTIAYFLSRYTLIIISSASIEITVKTTGSKRQEALLFINNIEKAIDDRMLYINKN